MTYTVFDSEGLLCQEGLSALEAFTYALTSNDAVCQFFQDDAGLWNVKASAYQGGPIEVWNMGFYPSKDKLAEAAIQQLSSLNGFIIQKQTEGVK